MSPAIEARGLVKRYAGRPVVGGVSLAVEPGEIFALLGPNGAGKTTTVEILEGFRRPDEGEARVLGLDPRRDLRRLAPRVGVMPQEGGLYAGIRPLEAIRQFAAFYAKPENPRALLRTVGLEQARRTVWRRLSGGERQRLSLALALVGRPEVAFLDEPTAGMDAHARASTWDLIRGLRDRGMTVLVTTHLLDEAERLADRVAIIHRGKLVAEGTPGALRERSSGSREVRFRAEPGLDLEALGTAVGGVAVAQDGGEYRLSGIDPGPELVARLTGWLAARDVMLADLVVGARSLEEVFLELTRDEP
jgi:ABC-2 type transport system ATP-binding protein